MSGYGVALDVGIFDVVFVEFVFWGAYIRVFCFLLEIRFCFVSGCLRVL